MDVLDEPLLFFFPSFSPRDEENECGLLADMGFLVTRRPYPFGEVA